MKEMTAGMIYDIGGVPQVGYTPNTTITRLPAGPHPNSPLPGNPRPVLPFIYLSLATRYGEQEKQSEQYETEYCIVPGA